MNKFRLFILISLTNEFKFISIRLMCQQLQGNTKRDDPNIAWDTRIFQNYLKWHGSIDETTKDLI